MTMTHPRIGTRGAVVAACMVLIALLATGLGAGAALGQGEEETATEGPPTADGAEKKVVKIGWMGEIDNLNPLIGWTNNVYEIYANQYLLMVGREWATNRPNDEGIAKSWELSDDELTWTFTMNEGMKWQDGEPITSEDPVFTYNFIIENDIESYSLFVQGIDRAEVIDENTYRVICKEPVANMLQLFMPCLPEHIWSKLTPKEAKSTFQNPPPNIGSGPFQVTEWKKERFLRMEAFDDFFLGKPTIDELLFVVYQNGDTMVQDLKSGAIDAAYLFPPAQWDALKNEEELTTIEFSWANWDYIGFNCYEGRSTGHPALLDKDFRAALEYAMDRQTLVDVAWGGHAWVGYTFLPPENWKDPDYAWQPPADMQRNYDPETAKKMLDDGGYVDTDGDGIREYKGENIKLRLWALAEVPESQRSTRLIAGWWKDVGIDVQLTVQDEGIYFDRIWNYDGDTFEPDFDAFYWQWDGYTDPGQSLTCFTTEQIEGWNEMAWDNAEYSRLDKEQAREMDPDKRAELIHQMQEVMYEDCPAIVTVFPLKLESYNTGKWDGWSRCNFENGPAFLSASMPWAYWQLTPAAADEAGASGDSDLGLWVGIGVGAAVVVALIAFFAARSRRKGPALEE
jgi:peptide/nickel transport system substrate-binding protein